MKFPRFVIKYPDDITGGILLFGIVMIIGIAMLYFTKKAYQAGVTGQGIKHEQSQRDSGIRVCKSSGGTWTGNCCNRPKRSLPRGVPKCSR
jgi:hypothetical protein